VLHRSRQCRHHGRAEDNWFGQDERQFLTALRGIAASGRTPADEKLDLYHGRWRGSVDPIFAEFAYRAQAQKGQTL
jgi:glutamate--cysteine ligase